MKNKDTTTCYHKVVMVGTRSEKLFLRFLFPVFYNKNHLHLKCQFRFDLSPSYINLLKNGSTPPPPPTHHPVGGQVQTIKSPQKRKNTILSFLPSPPLNLQTVQAPFFRQFLPIYWFFVNPSPQKWIFQ